ncbi:MAG: glycosyltransferase [Lachnospiraceae bacterium]|nr:glycosyltransferase [Lachnospiraceae bacterium]
MSFRSFLHKHEFLYEAASRIIDPVRALQARIYNRKLAALSTREIMELDAELYKKRTGMDLDWSNLRTYTEIMQWEKIFDRNPMKAVLSDKLAVRDWVSRTVGEAYLIPLIGSWDRYSDIDFGSLPEQFVMKTNHGSSDVVIVRDKSSMTWAEKMRMRRIITTSMRTDYAGSSYELHYSSIRPKIIVEKYIDSGEADLRDYKFLCFNGKPYCCWVDFGRHGDHRRNMYDLDWNLQDWTQNHFPNTDESVPKPEHFDEMVRVAEALCKDFPHVRVDLYNVDGKIYFGEMTFTNGSGFKRFYPDEMNLKLGRLWGISTEIPDLG